MFLYVTKNMAAELKEVLNCSEQWTRQENTWNTFERGADTIIVEQYDAPVSDLVYVFGPLEEMFNGSKLWTRILRENAYALELFWAWVEMDEVAKVEKRWIEPSGNPYVVEEGEAKPVESFKAFQTGESWTVSELTGNEPF